MDKSSSSGEKNKRKDKKPGMLSGLFKRKDKKGKVPEEDVEEPEKTSEESARSSPQPKLSSESLQETRNGKSQGPQRQSSKLQKQLPAELSLAKPDLQQNRTPQEPNDASSPTKEDFGQSIRRVVSPPSADVPAPLRLRSPETAHEPTISPPSDQSNANGDSSSPVKTVDSVSPTDTTSKPYDDAEREESASISSPTNQSGSITSPVQQAPQRPTPDRRETLSESPVDVSPIAVQAPSQLPGLMADTDDRSISPLSPQSSSPELIDAAETKAEDTTPMSTSSSTTHSSWSDASLRSYLDNEHDIRDLLIIVHDKSNVQPAGPDHPITGSLFKEESKRLKEMSSQLDEMLSAWVSRKLERLANK